MRLRLVIAFAFAASLAAHAKGKPDVIILSGGALAHEILITDAASLKSFDPWMGQFADWKQPVVAAPSCSGRAYEVQFFMKWAGRRSAFDRGEMKMIYSTRYCFVDDAGYVYLPGRDEANYMGNVSTIIRDGRDGRWSRATPQWDALIAKATRRKEEALTSR